MTPGIRILRARQIGFVALSMLGLLSCAGVSADDDAWTAAATVLERRCLRCHQGTESGGGLSLASAAELRAGGDGGAAVVPGDAERSPLIEQVAGAEPEMPRGGPPLGETDIAALRRWITQGASWPDGVTLRDRSLPDTDWWSLKPLVRPALPVLDASRDQARTAVDYFILARLQPQGLRLSPEADRRTLIRRLYFDLLGLPPSSAEVDDFVRDQSPSAYERLVDELLASPAYGERWARHWLDVVHYGDTHGYDKDKLRPNAWPYRDYVIRAFNDDKPYHRFVEEQIAGDVLWPETATGVMATGFLAAGPWDFIGHAEVPESKIDGQVARHLDRDDMVTTTMNTFLSLTVQCAQCHDHKFDPVRQEDYYRLQAVFAALDRADRTFDVDPDVGRKRRMLTATRAELTQRCDQLKSSHTAPADLRELDELANRLAAVSDELARLPAPQQVFCGCVHTGKGNFLGTGHLGGRPREIRVLRRGNVQLPGPVVGPGTVAIIPGCDPRFTLPDEHREGDRRAALAQWITRPDNPLTWRSLVNRVWQYHFGRGLVDSPNDFGRMGQLPSHPELLDWLAVEFGERGQSIKALHRLIVCSATYRQVSTPGDSLASAAIDAENRFYWRMNRRKLDAESIRDAVLSVAGRMDRRMYGPAFQDFVIDRPEHSPHYEYGKHDPDDPRTHRRSVYRFLVRSQPEPFMNALDCADPSQLVDKRNETLTALQALAMLNNKFMLRMSQHFADRVSAESDRIEDQIIQACRLALGRSPQAAERDSLVEFAEQYGLANTCRAIFNLNEFAFVD